MPRDKAKNKEVTKASASNGKGEILVTAQQSRFHVDAIDDPTSRNVRCPFAIIIHA